MWVAGWRMNSDVLTGSGWAVGAAVTDGVSFEGPSATASASGDVRILAIRSALLALPVRET